MKTTQPTAHRDASAWSNAAADGEGPAASETIGQNDPTVTPASTRLAARSGDEAEGAAPKLYLITPLIHTHGADSDSCTGHFIGFTRHWETARMVARKHEASWFGHYLLEGACIITEMEDTQGAYLGRVFESLPPCPPCEWTRTAVHPFLRIPRRVLQWMDSYAHRQLPETIDDTCAAVLPRQGCTPWWVRPWERRAWPQEEIAYRRSQGHATGRQMRDLDSEGHPHYLDGE